MTTDLSDGTDRKLTRNQKRKHDEINHVQKVYTLYWSWRNYKSAVPFDLGKGLLAPKICSLHFNPRILAKGSNYLFKYISGTFWYNQHNISENYPWDCKAVEPLILRNFVFRTCDCEIKSGYLCRCISVNINLMLSLFLIKVPVTYCFWFGEPVCS